MKWTPYTFQSKPRVSLPYCYWLDMGTFQAEISTTHSISLWHLPAAAIDQPCLVFTNSQFWWYTTSCREDCASRRNAICLHLRTASVILLALSSWAGTLNLSPLPPCDLDQLPLCFLGPNPAQLIQVCLAPLLWLLHGYYWPDIGLFPSMFSNLSLNLTPKR